MRKCAEIPVKFAEKVRKCAEKTPNFHFCGNRFAAGAAERGFAAVFGGISAAHRVADLRQPKVPRWFFHVRDQHISLSGAHDNFFGGNQDLAEMVHFRAPTSADHHIG